MKQELKEEIIRLVGKLENVVNLDGYTIVNQGGFISFFSHNDYGMEGGVEYFEEVISLNEEVATLQKKKEALTRSIDELERQRKEVQKAIQVLRKTA